MPLEPKAFSAFFSCEVDERGRLQIFHVCSDLTEAKKWKIEQEKKTKKEKDDSKTISSVEESPNQPIGSSFADIIDRLMTSIMSFYDLISINTNVRKIFPNIYIDNEFDVFLDKNNILESDNDICIYGVEDDKISSLNSKLKRLSHIRDGISSIPANVIMGLVARFDANISRLVRYLLAIRKERLASNEKMISVKDVLAASSFDELISDLIDDEIYSLMRGSHEDQIKYIEDSFSIKVRETFDKWPQFIEVFERRNLAAHGEGTANARYDRICSRAKVPTEHRLSIGARVSFPDKYLRDSTDVLLEFGILLTWWLWLKHEPQDAEVAYNKINGATYDMILERRYKLASRILHSCLARATNNAPESVRRMMSVNLANCYKKIENDEGFQKAISMFDWSASADEYKISIASLNDNVEEVCNLMHKVTTDETVGKSGFRDWPVFDWVRNDERFIEKFREVFGEPLHKPNTTEKSDEEGQSTPTPDRSSSAKEVDTDENDNEARSLH